MTMTAYQAQSNGPLLHDGDRIEVDVHQFDRGSQGTVRHLDTVARTVTVVSTWLCPAAPLTGPLKRASLPFVSYNGSKYRVDWRDSRWRATLPGPSRSFNKADKERLGNV